MLHRPASAPQRATRVPFWDTARFVAVTLVVIGHAIQRLTLDSDAALVVYLAIYAFHMPVFAIVSGYFSSANEPTRTRMTRVITDLVVPYLIMETLWTLTKWALEGDLDVNPTRPSWTLWFLLALAIFRIILPYLALLRFPVTISIIASVAVGYLDNVDHTFSLARAIGFLPFFVIGWRMRSATAVDAWLDPSRKHAWARAAAVGVLAAWVAVVAMLIDVWRAIDLRYWFFFDRGYEDLLTTTPVALGGPIRLAVIALALLLAFAFLALVPRRRTLVTELGRATMYVYLLHSFVLFPIREVLPLGRESWAMLALMILAAIAIAIVLASRPIRDVFRPLIEPRVAWLLARDHPPSPERKLPTVSTDIDQDARRT